MQIDNILQPKKGAFKSFYLGQLCTYFRLVDDQMRESVNRYCTMQECGQMEYVIQEYDKLLGVAIYKTSDEMSEKLKQALLNIEELKKLL